jgi:hypothetical protein
MSEPKTYTGGCHCGKVRYRAKLDLEKPVIACNCSMCGRVGSMLTFIGADDFTLLSGEEVLTDYLFNHKHIHHLFCSVCGIKSFARGMNKDRPMVAVNTRCLDDVDIDKLTVQHFDGKAV